MPVAELQFVSWLTENDKSAIPITLYTLKVYRKLDNESQRPQEKGQKRKAGI